MTKALIIGYGRAGRRLAQSLDRLQVQYAVVEPNLRGSLPEAVRLLRQLDDFTSNPQNRQLYDFAIVATPPALHIPQIRQCLDFGLPVLCEKPLCAFGQLAEAERLTFHPAAAKIGMAFNYRFHPAFMALPSMERWDLTRPWAALSIQYRESLPEWGLILDHLPHTLDLFTWLSFNATFTVDVAEHHRNGHQESIFAGGLVNGKPWNLRDSVHFKPTNKYAYLDGPMGEMAVDTPPEVVNRMTDTMLSIFIGNLKGDINEPFPGLADGLRVQRLLEAIGQKVNGKV